MTRRCHTHSVAANPGWDVAVRARRKDGQDAHDTPMPYTLFGLYATKKNPREWTRGFGGSDRRRSGDLSIFSRTLYQLSYRA